MAKLLYPELTLPWANGLRITQFFGSNAAYYSKFGFNGHEGADIVPITGTWDYSCVEGGKVVRDTDDIRIAGAYGNKVVIWNPDTLRAWWYCHNEKNIVQLGQVVKTGERIARMGQSGNTTGPHIHLGLRMSNKDGIAINLNNGYKGFVDPLPVMLKLAGEGAVMPDEYKGLDLSNKESMKAAVDIWYAVVKEKAYVKAEDYNKLKESSKTRIEEEEKRYKEFLEELAVKLSVPADQPKILENIAELLAAKESGSVEVNTPGHSRICKLLAKIGL